MQILPSAIGSLPHLLLLLPNQLQPSLVRFSLFSNEEKVKNGDSCDSQPSVPADRIPSFCPAGPHLIRCLSELTGNSGELKREMDLRKEDGEEHWPGSSENAVLKTEANNSRIIRRDSVQVGADTNYGCEENAEAQLRINVKCA